jgi:hypothetical protein
MSSGNTCPLPFDVIAALDPAIQFFGNISGSPGHARQWQLRKAEAKKHDNQTYASLPTGCFRWKFLAR